MGTINAGSEGIFYAVENRGNVWSGGIPSTLADFDSIIGRLDKQGAIEENVLFVNREMSFDIDDMLAAQNSYGAGGTSYGLFDNDEQMALNLGFTGFRRGYDFYKSDWKYLNDPTMRGDLTNWRCQRLCWFRLVAPRSTTKCSARTPSVRSSTSATALVRPRTVGTRRGLPVPLEALSNSELSGRDGSPLPLRACRLRHGRQQLLPLRGTNSESGYGGHKGWSPYPPPIKIKMSVDKTYRLKRRDVAPLAFMIPGRSTSRNQPLLYWDEEKG